MGGARVSSDLHYEGVWCNVINVTRGLGGGAGGGPLSRIKHVM